MPYNPKVAKMAKLAYIPSICDSRVHRGQIFVLFFSFALNMLFQYFFLVPEFEYFDFNDNVLNLVGAGLGLIIVHTLGGKVVEIKRFKWYQSPAIITGIVLLILFCLLLLTGKMTINPAGIEGSANWFSLNRATMPAGEFWKEAYPGRRFHILRPAEGIFIIYLLFAGFFFLDMIRGHSLNPRHPRAINSTRI